MSLTITTFLSPISQFLTILFFSFLSVIFDKYKRAKSWTEKKKERIIRLVFANRYRVERKLLPDNHSRTTNKNSRSRNNSSQILKRIRAPKIFFSKISFSPAILRNVESWEKSYPRETNYEISIRDKKKREKQITIEKLIWTLSGGMAHTRGKRKIKRFQDTRRSILSSPMASTSHTHEYTSFRPVPWRCIQRIKISYRRPPRSLKASAIRLLSFFRRRRMPAAASCRKNRLIARRIFLGALTLFPVSIFRFWYIPWLNSFYQLRFNQMNLFTFSFLNNRVISVKICNRNCLFNKWDM